MNYMDRVCHSRGLELFDKFNLIKEWPSGISKKIQNPYYFTDEGMINGHGVLDNTLLPEFIVGNITIQKFGENKVEEHWDEKLTPDEIKLLQRSYELNVCTGCWLKDEKQIAEKIAVMENRIEDMTVLLKEAMYEIENNTEYETDLSHKIRELLCAEADV